MQAIIVGARATGDEPQTKPIACKASSYKIIYSTNHVGACLAGDEPCTNNPLTPHKLQSQPRLEPLRRAQRHIPALLIPLDQTPTRLAPLAIGQHVP